MLHKPGSHPGNLLNEPESRPHHKFGKPESNPGNVLSGAYLKVKGKLRMKLASLGIQAMKIKQMSQMREKSI